MPREEEERFVHPDGGYGWVVIFGVILINSSLLALVSCFGILFNYEFTSWGVTKAETAFLLHLNNFLNCVFGFLCGPFLKKYSMRNVALVGASLMCSGILLTSFADSYIFLIFSVSILMGVGQGILTPALYLATYTYFHKRLTVAISISVTGSNISSVLMPKICDILMSAVRRQNTVLILFGISLLSFIGCFLLKPLKTQEEKQGHPECEETLDNNASENQNISNKEEVSKELLTPSNDVHVDPTIRVFRGTMWEKISLLFDLHLLRDRPFVLVVIALGMSFAVELNLILMIQFILQQLPSLSRSIVANMASVMAVADIIGRLVIPMITNLCHVPSNFMYASALIFATVGRTILATLYHYQIVVYAAVTLIGLTKGCRAVFQSVIIPNYVPQEKIATATGLNMLFTGTMSVILGPIIGAINDLTKSYVYALHAISAVSTLCVILLVVERITSRRKPVIVEENK